MNKKNTIKFTLDIVMAILFITFFNKNLISFKFHIISGYIFAGFILTHILLNKKWVINIGKRLFDRKIKLRVKISYILNLILFMSIIIIILSGVLMLKSTNYDRIMFWKMMHFGASYISIGLIGIHIGLYWNFLINMLKKILNLKGKSKNSKILSRIVVILILVFGIYTMNSQSYFDKVNNTITYVIKHIEPQDLREPEVKDYKKDGMPFIKLVTTYGSIISVFGISTYYGDRYIRNKY